MSNEMLVDYIKNGADRNGQYMLQLYNQNIGILYKVIHMLRIPSDLEEEVKQEFFLWLSDAVRNYDSAFESKFGTYLMESIKGRMVRYVEDQSCCKMSSHRHDRMRMYRREKQRLMQIIQREPTPKELSRFMGITLNELAKIENDLDKKTVCSLNDVTAEGTEIIDLIPDRNNPIEELENRLDIELRNKALWALVTNNSELNKEIIIKYYKGECGANKLHVRNEYYRMIDQIKRNRKQLRILAELSNYDNFNCCRSKSVYAFHGTHTSIVEDIVFRKMNLESEETI